MLPTLINRLGTTLGRADQVYRAAFDAFLAAPSPASLALVVDCTRKLAAVAHGVEATTRARRPLVVPPDSDYFDEFNRP